MYDVPVTHKLHAGYGHKVVQTWSSGLVNEIPKSSLVWPLFIVENDDDKQVISSMPGQFRWGVNRLREALDEPVSNGLRAVLLFGVIENPSLKDETATGADKEDAPVIKAVKFLRSTYPDLLIMCDLCLCGYTSHGHCGILKGDHTIDNDSSVKRLSELAVSYAKAGAHNIAPSDMMDGRIGAIKAALNDNGFGSTVSVMSYASKFASCFYGPFRDAANSGMSFGDRSLYQLPPGSRSLAIRAAQRDINEGADFIMVKPGMPYLDICRDLANETTVPLAVYQVSGEYAMIYAASEIGALDKKRAVMESFTAFRRAGVTVIISYFAPEALKWL